MEGGKMKALCCDSADALKRELESHMIRHIIPGMLHNFANPINGMMGRAKLLQRRLEARGKGSDISEKDECLSSEILEKVIHDVDLISKGGDQLLEIFNIVVGKFQRLYDMTEQHINMSELIRDEMAFFDFYLDFKHTVKKKTLLDYSIPLVRGVPAAFSMSLSAFINHSMNSMKDSDSKCLVVMTGHDSDHVFVRIEDMGVPLGDDDKTRLAAIAGKEVKPLSLNGAPGIFHAAAVLGSYGASIDVEGEGGINRFIVKLPY